MASVLRGEIYWAELDPTLGTEQSGRRPVLILHSDCCCANQSRAESRFPADAGNCRVRFSETLVGENQPDTHFVGTATWEPIRRSNF